MNNLSRVLSLCAVLLLTACAEEDPQQYINEGKALFEKGEMEGARVQFKNALQIDPKLAEAYYGLSLLDEKKPDWPAMKRNLQDTVRLDPNHIEARVKLGFLFIGQVEKAKEHVTMALQQDPDNIKAILLKGRINFREDKKAEALQQVDQVLAKDSANAEALWLQATVLMSDKQYDVALEVLNRGIDAHPKNVGLGLLKVKLHKESEQYEEVVRDYDNLVAMHPEDKTLRYARIKVLAEAGKTELAEKALREAIKKDPDDIGLKLSLVNNVELRDTKQAEILLKEFIEEQPQELKFKSRLAGLYIGNKRSLEAQVILNEIVAIDPTGQDGLTAKVRLAEMTWAQNDKVTAERLAEEILSVDVGNSEALLFRAGVRIDKADADGAIADLRIVLRDQPNSDQAMVMMASAHVLKNEFEVAESNLRKAIEINPSNLSAIVPLTSALLKSGDANRAENLLLKSIKASPGTPELLELLIKLRISQKNWVGTEAAVNELRELPQGNLAAQMLTAMLAEEQGLYQEAIRIYENILASWPDATDALEALARSFKAQGNSKQLNTFLKDFIEVNPDRISAYNMLGQAYAKQAKWNEANNILQQALKVEPKSILTYRLLAAVLAQQGKTDEVVALYRKSLAELPDNPVMMMELANYYASNQHVSYAISIYDNLLRKYPGNDEAANNLADLLVNTRTDPAELKRALLLVERFKKSQNPYFLDTYGWVLYKSGNLEQAVTVLKEAVTSAPNNATLHYHLGEAYHATGKSTDSKTELEKSLSLAKQQGKFAGIERAKQLLKLIANPVGA